MDDIYSMFVSDDEPSVQEVAAARAAALRRQQAFGNLGLLTGDKVLSSFGRSQIDQSGQGEQLLEQLGQHRLSQTMAAHKAKQDAIAQAQKYLRDRSDKAADMASERAYQQGRDQRQFANAREVARIAAQRQDDRQQGTEDKALEKEQRAEQRKLQEQAREVEEYYQNIDRTLGQLDTAVAGEGTWDLTGPQNAILEGLVTSYATDMAKLRDPKSIAKEGEVALEKKGLFNPGLLTKNSTARAMVARAKGAIKERRNEAYRIRGLTPPPDRESQAASEPKSGRVTVTNGKETLEIEASDLAAAQLDGFKVKQ